MFCDHCGNEIANDAIVCPLCGVPTETKVQYTQPSMYQGRQGQFPQDDLSKFGGPALYQLGYSAAPPMQSVGYMPPFPQQTPGYAPTGYSSMYPQMNVTMVQNTSSNETPLVAEIILSLFGVFGVGWILGGETTVGIVLLICSIFIYWPVMILGTLFTFGIGLVCLGPLAIGAIILNALLCHNALKRRAARLTILQSTPPPHVPMPPPMQRPQ